MTSTTDDKTLLELAAKAAGTDWFRHTDGGLWQKSGGIWNPLTDDGDALRLAMKLRISFYRAESSDMLIECGYFDDETVSWIYIQEANDDPYLATRRAIVRAAAEIGKTL